MEGGICLFDAADQVWRESNKISPRYSHLKKIVALPGKNVNCIHYAACPHFFGQLESICISMNNLRCTRCQELKFGEQLSHSNAHRSVSRNFVNSLC